MGLLPVARRRGDVPRRGVSALVVTLGLDGLAVLLFLSVLGYVGSSHARGTSNETFFSDPLPAALLLAAATVAIAAGIGAAVSLARRPLASRAGRWATRLALVNALLIPAVGLSVTAAAWLVAYDLPEGWGQPVMPFWMMSGLAAGILGIVANEPGRRGALVIPFMAGALVVTFWAGELLVPH
jgi:multisubunit Na+/H+ antiporter MnhC subunit